MREWQIKRRERTRLLIELGGLVVKANLVELTDDDRALLYGAFLWMAGKLQSDDAAHIRRAVGVSVRCQTFGEFVA